MGYKVMIIDDNEIDNFIGAKIIKEAKFSHDILVMDSGHQALEYIQANKHNPDKLPDFIFLDLNMPVVDGFVFLFEFEDFPLLVRNHCKIIVLSSLLEPSIINKVSKNPYVLDFFSKPLNLQILQQIINKIVV